MTDHSALDRSNLGNARLQGLPEDVLGGDKTGVLFDWLTSGFYFTYVCPSRMTLRTTPDFQEDPIPNSGNPFLEIVSTTSVCGHRRHRMGPNIDTYGSCQSVPRGVRVFDGAQSAGFNFAGLMAARLLLGVFEAGFGPVITLYFCKPLFSFVILGFLSISYFGQLSSTPNRSLAFESVKSCKPFHIR